MTKEKLKYFKNLLRKRLEDLLTEAGGTVKNMSGKGEVFPDPVDRASLESDRNFLLRIRDRERKLIIKIERALERIENGTFGFCERCGEEISGKRLKARPVTTFCIDCKEEQENEEKGVGS
ncbi:MAG: RNA polymerase-binding protein DksA [Deltaproteobacteria bacterium]|nr:RNA polymerase-binding protein DksA [Deltaproteobacteria bacterium]